VFLAVARFETAVRTWPARRADSTASAPAGTTYHCRAPRRGTPTFLSTSIVGPQIVRVRGFA